MTTMLALVTLRMAALRVPLLQRSAAMPLRVMAKHQHQHKSDNLTDNAQKNFGVGNASSGATSNVGSGNDQDRNDKSACQSHQQEVEG